MDLLLKFFDWQCLFLYWYFFQNSAQFSCLATYVWGKLDTHAHCHTQKRTWAMAKGEIYNALHIWLRMILVIINGSNVNYFLCTVQQSQNLVQKNVTSAIWRIASGFQSNMSWHQIETFKLHVAFLNKQVRRKAGNSKSRHVKENKITPIIMIALM